MQIIILICNIFLCMLFNTSWRWFHLVSSLSTTCMIFGFVVILKVTFASRPYFYINETIVLSMIVMILNDLYCYLKTKEKSSGGGTSIKCRFTCEIAVSDGVINNFMTFTLWTAHRSVVTPFTQ